MSLRFWALRVVYDAEGGAGGGAAGTGAGDAGTGTAASTGDDTVSGGGDTLPGADGARPEWLAGDDMDEFWDAEAGAPRAELLASKLRETRAGTDAAVKAAGEQAVAALRANAPAEASGYVLQAGEGVLPEGFEAAFPDDSDPFLVATRSVMHELGASPEQFGKLTDAFLRWQASTMPNVAAERTALGEGAEARIAKVDGWLAKQLPEAEYAALSNSVLTAAGVQAIERLMRGGRADPLAGGGLPGSGGDGAGEAAEIRALMRHPDYNHHHRGREMQAKVSAFFARGGRLARAVIG